MRPFHKQVLDSNRHHLQNIKNGVVKGIFLNDFIEIEKFYINPHAGAIDDTDFNSVANLVKKCYMWYDDYCARVNPREMQMQDIALLEKYRNVLNETMSIGSAYKDFFRVMVLYYDPHYMLPHHLDSVGINDLIRNVYKHYDGIEQAFNSIEIIKPNETLNLTFVAGKN